MSEPTIWPLQPHTRVKHEIYDGYLDAWFPIMLSRWSVTYAEGFAGPGVYERGEPGSPIRALRRLHEARIKHAHIRQRPVRFVLIEKQADRVERLLAEFRRELNHPMPNGEYRDATLHVVVRRGLCETTLPRVLTQVDAWKEPILAILDSFGGGSTQALIHRFAQRRGNEVLVTVEPQHFVRNLNPVRANEVFGGKNWQVVNALPPDRKRSFIASELEHAIRNAGFQYVLTFGLETADSSELLLQFGTNHIKGVDKFKDSLWDADPIGGARFRDPKDPDQMLLELGADPNAAPLQRMLAAHLETRSQRSATVSELCNFALEHTIYRVPHVRPALARMLDERVVTIGSLRRDAAATQIKAQMRVTLISEPPNLFSLDSPREHHDD